MESEKALVRIEDLSVCFGKTEAVRHVSLEVAPGEILGVVGESGSGKSVTALTLMGLVAESATISSGKVMFDGTVLAEAGKTRDSALYRKYQGERMSMIFQEPMTSLNPTKKVGLQVEEMLLLHTGLSKEERREKIFERFAAVGLKEQQKLFGCYPHQLSGGMRQRVMIAMATILHPDLIIADEPTTALDVTIQNQVIELLKEINQREQNALIFITHDLNLARRLCGRVAVMRDGCVVESGSTEEIFERPKESYTQQLIAAAPSRKKAKVFVQAGYALDQQRRQESGGADGRQAQEGGGKDIRQAQESGGEDGRQAQESGGKDIRQASKGAGGAADVVVSVDHLNVYYPEKSGRLFGRKTKFTAVSDAAFVIYRGETLGLVGESGCGKSSLSKAVLGMNKDIDGKIQHFSVRPQMIFQDPYSSLNPCKTVEWLLEEPLRAAGEVDDSWRLSKAERRERVCDMLYKVGLSEKYLDRKPSQLSGGQRQRISIGQALITHPGLVIADEPVSALDVTLQAQIMELMQKLQAEMGVAYLFISHDINVVYQMSDRIMVMKNGHIIEQGETEEIFRNPRQSYTQLLLRES